MGIFLVLAGALVGMAALFLLFTAVGMRDVVSITIAIDLATLAAVLFAGGGIVLAVDKLRPAKPAEPTPDP